MKSEELIQLIKHPENVHTSNLPALEELEKKHPYFQAIKVLKLKILKDSDDLRFKEYLKEVAVSVPDRKVLYKILLREAVKAKIEEHFVVLENSSAGSKSENTSADDSGGSKSENTSTDGYGGLESENTSAESYGGSKEEGTGTSVNNEQLEKLTNDVLDELLKTGSSSLYQIEKFFELDEKSQSDTETEGEGEGEGEGEVIQEKDSDHSTSRDFFDWLEPKKTIKEKPKSQEDIINTFIQNQPRISKLDKDSTDKSVHLKITEQDGLVTETLARVYLKQKNYAKAIEIYEKLCLTIPEKKGYFASQIHFLQGLIKKD